MRFFIPRLTFGNLLFEPPFLIDGVVQFGIRISNLFAANEQLETFHQVGIILLLFG